MTGICKCPPPFIPQSNGTCGVCARHQGQPDITPQPVARPYPRLLDDTEKADLLKRAENLWSDLQRNDLGGFSGINRPFWILHQFQDIIEVFGGRDVGLHWSQNDLDAARAKQETTHGR